jgi:hypothetical protein
MKRCLPIFLILFFSSFSVCLSQARDTTYQEVKIEPGDKIEPIPIFHNGPEKCLTCECNLDNLLRSWNKENIRNYDLIIPESYRLIDTLTDSLKIGLYYKKITDPEQYCLGYSGNTKRIILSKRKDVRAEADKEIILKFNAMLPGYLTLNSTVYAIRLRLKNGNIVENYSICDPGKQQITYDTMFLYFWLFKITKKNGPITPILQ